MTAFVPIWCTYRFGLVSSLIPEACGCTGTDAEVLGCLWLLSETFWGLAGSSRRLPGWPRNNAAHLEAAPLGSERSDGWGDLSGMSSWACRQGPNQSPSFCLHWRTPTPAKTHRSRVLSRHLQLLTLVFDHRQTNSIMLRVHCATICCSHVQMIIWSLVMPCLWGSWVYFGCSCVKRSILFKVVKV